MEAGDFGQSANRKPLFSIVICTDDRAESLKNTLVSLGYLEYDNFEVCVVRGPTDDGTRDVLAEYAGRIKVAFNPVRNLSISRNIGIALAAGHVIAYIDDDSIPEPEWLIDLAAAYNNPLIGGAGGFVHDHLGTGFQTRYESANRLARAQSWEGPVTQLSFPFTDNFPHLLGANSTFRRDALLAIGGFDEEYDYYLDETDVCARMVGAGWIIETVTGAFVHHRFLPSSFRSVEHGYRVLQTRYSVIKNSIYFSLMNRTAKYGFNEIINDARDFIEQHARDVNWLISEGFLPEEARARYWAEVDQAWAVGLARGLSGERKLIAPQTLKRFAQPFLHFPQTIPFEGRRTFCFISQEYMSGKMGGIGRYTNELATGVAAMGHHVHVIAKADSHDCIDYEQGVWVHRKLDEPAHIPQPGNLHLPQHIWDRATTVERVLDQIAMKRPITAVSAPIWDCEGMAVLVERRYPLMTTLHTSMAPYLAANPSRAADHSFVRDFARPVIQAEIRLMRESDRVIANSHAIVDEIEQMYQIGFDPTRMAIIPHGIGDWTCLPQEAPAPLPPGSLRVLFVGRLEERKGIDVLLACAPRILMRHPHVYLDLVGSDTIVGPKGLTFREAFVADPRTQAFRDRVTFHGSVSDAQLRGYYQACDIFVAPSRFESFGLILVEGMMFGKPVIGCNAGGMTEVVEDGVSGLLAKPGDASSLEACLGRLISDADLRASLGAAGRRRYEAHFTAPRMATEIVNALADAATAHAAVIQGDRNIPSTASHALGQSAASTVVALKSSTPKVVIVAPMLARNDAISAAVCDTYRTLAGDTSIDVAVLACRNDFEDMPAEAVTGLTSLLLHPKYLAADLLLYHFGVFHDLFNALIVGNGHARQVVCFHNITPLEFAGPAQVDLIEASFRQASNLVHADEIWTVSEVNKKALDNLGISGDHVHVIPLAVEEPGLRSLGMKSMEQIELLYVGRAVPSKGLLDLVRAFDLARRQTTLKMRLRIAGSLEWSDQEYLSKVKMYTQKHRLQDVIELLGVITDQQRDILYQDAHILAIPSYHEGFCKPVVEGLRAGCIPVGYEAFNTPLVANGLGRLVPPGSVESLAQAIANVAEGIARATRTPEFPALPLDRGATSLTAFDRERDSHVGQFTFGRLKQLTRQRTQAVLSLTRDPRQAGASQALLRPDVASPPESLVPIEIVV